jgi:competence protein ComFC
MLGVPVAARALARIDASPQMNKSGRVRRERTQPMFRAKKSCAALRGKRVLLVDDVRTTGTTLLHAARALRAAGVTEVDTLALALAL